MNQFKMTTPNRKKEKIKMYKKKIPCRKASA